MSTSSENVGHAQIRESRGDDHVVAGVPTVPADQDAPPWTRSRVAVVDGEVVGVATLRLSAVTDTYFCEITVAPDHRRRGIGRRLYAAVHGVRERPFPVVARAMRSRPLRRQFADAIGCSVLTHCPEPWIDPTAAEARHWIGQQALAPGHALSSMEQRSDADVRQAWTQYFCWSHRPLGTVHPEHLPQMWDRYRAGLDAEASQLAVESSTGDIRAFSLVSPDAFDGRTMIISETVAKDQGGGDQLLAATVAASLKILAARGTRLVELEGHSTDPHSPQLVRSLPPGGSDPMDILTLAAPG